MDPNLYQDSPARKLPLRIGVLLEATSLPRWAAEVLDHIAHSNFATIELIVFNSSAGMPRPAPSLIGKVIDALRDRSLRRTLLFNLYEHWDRRNADPSTDPVTLVNCSERLAHVESMHVAPIAKRFVHRFPDDAIQKIREKKLDVIIRFGFNILRGEILTAAKHGVWSYHHGDNDHFRGGPAYFWELFEKNLISGATLQVLTEELDAGKVLCKGLFATEAGISLSRNRVRPYWGASTFIIQKLRELHAFGWEHVEQRMEKPVPYQGKKKFYSTPSNMEMLKWSVPLLAGKALRRLVRRPMVQHWKIAVRVGAQPIPGSISPPDMSDFCWVESPKGRFYADPFPVEADGKHWVYFEDYDYATELGKISCAEVMDGTLGEPLTALKRPYHLSYPCVFRDHGTWYMIPESSMAHTVELYRCTRFPGRWQLERELLKGFAVDTTVWIENDVYWFFVTYLEPRGYAGQLWLYSASSLDGAWTAHPENPISTDIRYARGAGAIFRHKGKLFRPSQDGSGEYGRSMILNEIVKLDHGQYREVPRMTVDPTLMKELTGTHTYGLSGAIEFIDGKARLLANRVR